MKKLKCKLDAPCIYEKKKKLLTKTGKPKLMDAELKLN